MKKILIVEDDELINDGIAFALRKENYMVYQAHNGKSSMERLNVKPDLVLLDITLPDINGIELCEKIKVHLDVPLIFITAKDTEQDVIKGFDAGSEDYITKPFSMPILLKRVQVVLKRSQTSNRNKYFMDDLIYDMKNGELIKDNVSVSLTATEKKLLTLLIQHKNQVITRDRILEQIWDIDENYIDDKTLNVHIRRLRKKIERDPSRPEYIKTVFGIGYKWNENL